MARKILIIEDEEILLDVLTKKLTLEGYEVMSATDGESGYEKIKELKPDLVLLDIVIPKMDGFELLEKLHTEKKTEKPPIIIISNSGQPVEIDRALKLGAVDYLVKAAFDPSEVIDKVKRFFKEIS